MKKIEVLILIALPASGKSEVMKFLQTRTPADLAQLHLGLPSHLDDYPYVEIMRKVDETAMKMLRMEPLFFHSLDRGFKDPYEWITLIELLNEDFRCYEEGDARSADAEFLFHRIDMAELRAGARMKLGRLPNDIRKLLAQHLAASVKEKEKKFELNCLHQVATKEKTAIVEFSRGAAIDAPLPLDPPYGYRFALSRLDPSILERAAILYIKVSPEESRRRNAERAVPPPGCTDTTLFHGVPTEVMLRDYGRDDFAEMFLDHPPASIDLGAHGKIFSIPAAVFDNEGDRTSFIRQHPKEPKKWSNDDCNRLFRELWQTLDELASAFDKLRH